MEDLLVKSVIQIIPSAGLWFRTVAIQGDPLPGPEFKPVVAIALVEIEAPHDRLFLSQAVLPLSSDDLMRGVLERSPNEGLRVERTIFHESDFEVLGHRLKENAAPRSHYDWNKTTGLDFARHLLDRERGNVADS